MREVLALNSSFFRAIKIQWSSLESYTLCLLLGYLGVSAGYAGIRLLDIDNQIIGDLFA